MSDLFGIQLYPTPPEVTDKMLEPYFREWRGENHLQDITIIDPSAGKGDILDRCAHYRTSKRHKWAEPTINTSKLFAIEIDMNLQKILRGKGYQLIGSDFMEYSDPYRFDLWLMNPPFRHGVDHLLHAWELAKSGDIACLLNASRINPDGTEKQKRLYNLIELFGEWENIGQVFADAERQTDVETALVRLHKPKSSDKIFVAGLTHDDVTVEAMYNPSALASRDPYQNIVAQYIGARTALEDKHLALAKINYFTDALGTANHKREMEEIGTLLASGKTSNEAAKILADKREAERISRELTQEAHAVKSLAEEITELKTRFWDYVFAKTNILQLASSKTAEKFRDMKDDYVTLAFTHHNLMMLVNWLKDNEQTMRDEFIESAFDKAIGYHKKNKIWHEGWATNSAHKLNKKTIIPDGCGLGDRYWSSAYRHADFYEDMDKALCSLSGIPLTEIHRTYTAISNREQGHDGEKEANGQRIHVAYDEPLESTFFKIRLHKKGTVHLTFKDLDLLDKFNYEAARVKKWLPGGEGY